MEAFDYLFGGRYKGESRLKIRDFQDHELPITISGRTDRFSVRSELQYYKGKHFNCMGAEFQAKPREAKQRGRLLSAPISAQSKFTLDENAYFNDADGQPFIQQKSQDTKAVDPRELTLDTGRFGSGGLDVFYFDKNRALHLASGTYRTTFDAICDDLNWRFQKKLRESGSTDEFASKVSNEFFVWAVDLAQKGTGSKLGEDFSAFFEDDSFKNLRIDLVNLLEPFSAAFLALRQEGRIQQIPTRSLGSGVELVLALLLQRLLSDSASGSKIILVDEPEMHLHPTAQRKLTQLLLEETKNSQVIVSSHSPYLLQVLIKYGRTNVFRQREGGGIDIEPQDAASNLFRWSPSFGEVNYKAFGMPTVEFHNELYGYLQGHHNLRSSRDLDNHLNQKGVPSDHSWINNRTNQTETVTECTYVRHSIHHPENQSNQPYDDAKLTSSIEKLKGAI